jgi:hypothetical protein
MSLESKAKYWSPKVVNQDPLNKYRIPEDGEDDYAEDAIVDPKIFDITPLPHLVKSILGTLPSDPLVKDYVSNVATRQTERGLAAVIDISSPLTNNCIVVQRWEDSDFFDPSIHSSDLSEDSLFVMVLEAARNSSYSQIDIENPNRQGFFDKYKALPRGYDPDNGGILFQGMIRKARDDEHESYFGLQNYMFELLPLDLIAGTEADDEYRTKQMGYAKKYLQPDSGDSPALIETLFREGRVKFSKQQ